MDRIVSIPVLVALRTNPCHVVAVVDSTPGGVRRIVQSVDGALDLEQSTCANVEGGGG